MSDPAPRRQIGGLNPLNALGAPSALDRMRGGTPAAPQPPAPSPPPQAAQTATKSPEKPPAPAEAPERASTTASAPQKPQNASTRPRSRTAAPAPLQRRAAPAEDAPKEQMTTYIARPTRERAKAAFKATQHLEGDESFSSFVQTAVERELERREKAHNGGKPYAGDGGRLTAGRPLS
jgi:hypothetical protein